MINSVIIYLDLKQKAVPIHQRATLFIQPSSFFDQPSVRKIEESVLIGDLPVFYGDATEWKRDARAPLCHASSLIVDASASIHH